MGHHRLPSARPVTWLRRWSLPWCLSLSSGPCLRLRTSFLRRNFSKSAENGVLPTLTPLCLRPARTLGFNYTEDFWSWDHAERPSPPFPCLMSVTCPSAASCADGSLDRTEGPDHAHASRALCSVRPREPSLNPPVHTPVFARFSLPGPDAKAGAEDALTHAIGKRSFGREWMLVRCIAERRHVERKGEREDCRRAGPLW